MTEQLPLYLHESEFPKKWLTIWIWNTGDSFVLITTESVNLPQEKELFFFSPYLTDSSLELALLSEML